MTLNRQGFLYFPPAMLAGFVLLIAMVAIALIMAVRLTSNAEDTARLSDYRRAVTDLSNAVRDAETSQRGFLLTRDLHYLAPYDEKSALSDRALTDIAAIGPRGPKVADVLRRLVTQKRAEMRRTIALERGGRHAEALAVVDSNRGIVLMNAITQIAERERQWALAGSKAAAVRSGRELLILTVALVGGVLAIIVLSLVWLGQARRQFADADEARTAAEQSLAALQYESAARKESEARLRQLQKMESLGQLTGGIAHDFNNMLGVIIGSIELAQRRLKPDPARANQYLENAIEGAKRAASLTARLLAFTRNQPLAPAPLDANKMIGGMSDLIGRTLGAPIAIETVFAAGLWRCYADPSEVENALLNLVINARDAMPDGGKLTIETGNAHVDDQYARTTGDVTPGQYVLMCVSDSGIGMTPDVLERAFDPFFTTKPVGRGTGLGLSQVFGFAKQSGGHAAIYSEPGKGTTVKVYLPRYTGAAVDAERIEPASEPPEGSANEIVLIVEDEPRMRDFAANVLAQLGYTPLVVENAAEALRHLEQSEDIALLFTDVVMPDMSGRELVERAQAIRPALKILYSTGYTRNSIVHSGALDVGVALLQKPYTILDLARKVREVLDGRGVNRPA